MAGSTEIALPRLEPSPVSATFAAFCANFVGIGLARFGYTPLIPALISAGWFAPSAAVYLAAANLAGYLLGALAARSAAALIGAPAILRTAMALTAASLFGCGLRLGFGWFFAWRLVSGCTGGVLMALAAPSAIAAVPPARRGIAGGVIFTGVGLGIVASGTLVPLLISRGLVATWFGLAVIASALTVLTWTRWPVNLNHPQHAIPRPSPHGSVALRALYLEYALNAVGLVPHMVFLVDFVARGLGRGLAAGSFCWIAFGAGAMIGPSAAGYIGDWIGFRPTLRLAFVVQAAAVAVPFFAVSGPSIAASSIVVGAFVPGIVAITIGRTRELIPHDPAEQAAAWGYCTTAFAIGQAIAGYGFSYIFSRTSGGDPILFGLGAASLLLALVIDLAAATTGSEGSTR